MPLPAVAVPPSGGCIILLSLAQILPLLLPPPPPLPPSSLCVCFRPHSLHPCILCTSQQQPSAQLWWVGRWGFLVNKWNRPQEQVGLWGWEMPGYSCSVLPSTLGSGTRTGCSTWLFLHWQTGELCCSARTAISLGRPCGGETFKWWGL